MPMKSFFLILVAGLILSVGNGFRMSLGIYVPDLLSSTVFGASMIGLTYGIFNLLWGCMSPIAGAFAEQKGYVKTLIVGFCLLYTSPSPRDLSTSRMPSSA